LKVRTPVFFCREILKTGKISGRTLKNPKKVGAKVGKKQTRSAGSVGYRRKSCDTDPVLGSETAYFFLPRNLFCRKIFGVKVENRKNFWTESFTAGFFPV
jgi:hypothetical protein